MTNMKQLKFDHNFAETIKSGIKTETFRVNDDKGITVGDDIQLVDKVDKDRPNTWLITGEMTVEKAYTVPLGELSTEHIKRVDGFESIEQMITTFRRFYGEFVNEQTPVLVMEFKYREYQDPIKYLDGINGDSGVYEKVKLYADGGSRGNPGPSALGFVIKDMDGAIVHSDNKYLGITTNNQAEYHAMIAGLEWCRTRGVQEVEVYLDSMLVVNQLKGVYKVKNRDLWSLNDSANQLKVKFRKISFTHIPREMNKLADSEVNKVLDAVKGSDVTQ